MSKKRKKQQKTGSRNSYGGPAPPEVWAAFERDLDEYMREWQAALEQAMSGGSTREEPPEPGEGNDRPRSRKGKRN
jgi:hypothetical protein